ncbi:uncharacterized protein FOMMEDRAFT_117264 [Fomitiporia mediterranea MF3/22]|uniref:uncharacterized protein n=1 Tax=Fomitiporia mediterranea (strain MF3/22) TaxID=694068 RepID=UPI0004408E19|nr:uncharacterized protein FOMMEDRAFT_117264 [Fomitiporia mediterranea MF3/22]EJD06451.1 hypothetical protein FOMMEDRAFT_117264 [Fomitiporia mediterranea MF3/22]
MNTHALRRLAVWQRTLTSVRPVIRREYATQEKDPQLGDYPQLPNISRGTLPPLGWWDNQMRRNFGDIPHEKDEMYSMWGPDPPTLEPRTALFRFGLGVAMFGGIMLFAYAATPELKAVRRQYPFDGLVKELGGVEQNKAIPESLEEDAE